MATLSILLKLETRPARESLDGALNANTKVLNSLILILTLSVKFKCFLLKTVAMYSRALVAHQNLTCKTLSNPFRHSRDVMEVHLKKTYDATQNWILMYVFEHIIMPLWTRRWATLDIVVTVNLLWCIILTICS